MLSQMMQNYHQRHLLLPNWLTLAFRIHGHLSLSTHIHVS